MSLPLVGYKQKVISSQDLRKKKIIKANRNKHTYLHQRT